MASSVLFNTKDHVTVGVGFPTITYRLECVTCHEQVLTLSHGSDGTIRFDINFQRAIMAHYHTEVNGSGGRFSVSTSLPATPVLTTDLIISGSRLLQVTFACVSCEASYLFGTHYALAKLDAALLHMHYYCPGGVAGQTLSDILQAMPQSPPGGASTPGSPTVSNGVHCGLPGSALVKEIVPLGLMCHPFS